MEYQAEILNKVADENFSLELSRLEFGTPMLGLV